MTVSNDVRRTADYFVQSKDDEVKRAIRTVIQMIDPSGQIKAVPGDHWAVDMDARILYYHRTFNGRPLAENEYFFLTFHEGGHLLYTPSMPGYPSDLTSKADRAEFRKIWNACEDMRMERKVMQRFPGFAAIRNQVGGKFAQEAYYARNSDLIAGKADPRNIAVATWLSAMYCEYNGLWGGGYSDPMGIGRYMQTTLVEDTHHLYQLAAESPSMQSMMQYVEAIYRLIFDQKQDEDEDEGTGEGEQGEQDEEPTEGEEQGEGGEGGEGDGEGDESESNDTEGDDTEGGESTEGDDDESQDGEGEGESEQESDDDEATEGEGNEGSEGGESESDDTTEGEGDGEGDDDAESGEDGGEGDDGESEDGDTEGDESSGSGHDQEGEGQVSEPGDDDESDTEGEDGELDEPSVPDNIWQDGEMMEPPAPEDEEVAEPWRNFVLDSASNRFATILRNMLRKNDARGKRRNVAFGKLDISRAHRMQSPIYDFNVFTRRVEPNQPRYALIISVDTSGSMASGLNSRRSTGPANRARQAVAMESAATLTEAWRQLRLPWTVFGWGSMVNYVVSDGSLPWQLDLVPARGSNGGGTDEHIAIITGLDLAMQYGSQGFQPLWFHLSDGDAQTTDQDRIDTFVRTFGAEHLYFIGIGMQSGYRSGGKFPNEVAIKNQDDLYVYMQDTIRRQVANAVL